MYSHPELIAVFAGEATANTVRDALFGLPVGYRMPGLLWEDDEDFPDLYVRPLEVHGLP